MLGKVSSEMKEIVWLAAVAGSLSIAGISLAVAAAFVLEHLT